MLLSYTNLLQHVCYIVCSTVFTFGLYSRHNFYPKLYLLQPSDLRENQDNRVVRSSPPRAQYIHCGLLLASTEWVTER